MGSYAQDIYRRLESGPVRTTHNNLPAALKLSGCNRVQLNAALTQLEESGKIWIHRSETHVHLGRRSKKKRRS